MNKTLTLVAASILLPVAFTSAQAAVATENVVRFSQGTNLSVPSGNTFTVDVIGENFTAGPDGAAFSLSWDPAVLSYVGAAIANPPWDASYIFEDHLSQGLIDYVFLAKTSPGDAGANFNLASFTFHVLGDFGSATALALGLDSYATGFVAPGAVPINTNFLNSLVDVIPASSGGAGGDTPPPDVVVFPIPAAAWLFASGLLGLVGWQRKRV